MDSKMEQDDDSASQRMLHEMAEWRERKQELKQEYGALWNKVSEILFRLDPMGINFGSNTDEYEPEVSSILPQLKDCESADDVRGVVYDEFVYWFGDVTAGEELDYVELAQAIWDAWNEYKML